MTFAALLPASPAAQHTVKPVGLSPMPPVTKTSSIVIQRALKVVGKTVIVMVVTALLAAVIFLLVARHALKPAPGDWATALRAGPVAVQVGVPSLIWLGTTPWVAALLDGRSLPTRVGTVHLRWQADSSMLTLSCKPCRIPAHALGSESLRVEAASLSVRRKGAQLDGSLHIGNVAATWHGAIYPQSLKLQIALPPTPIRDGYTLFASSIPELQQARIDGSFSFNATVSLPSGRYTLAPRVDGFAVHGLGTEALVGARSMCSAGLPTVLPTVKSKRAKGSGTGAPHAGLGPDSLLARAVIAAEDQRFFKHTGFDLVELGTSFDRNQQEGRIERGASTLSQQLARLLITGGERTPARKLRELLYAVEMEQTLGKARILRMYLAHAPWGNGICGAQAASRHYFGIRAQDLDAGQAVWLAAMLHQPAAEAQRWASTGHINLPRAQWVATSLRPMPRRQREALAERLGQVAWPAPEATVRPAN
jgi:Transglycosylase